MKLFQTCSVMVCGGLWWSVVVCNRVVVGPAGRRSAGKHQHVADLLPRRPSSAVSNPVSGSAGRTGPAADSSPGDGQTVQV